MLEPLPPLPDPEMRRKLRLAMGVTIVEACSLLGVSRETYRKWEYGRGSMHPGHQRDYAHLLASWQAAVDHA